MKNNDVLILSAIDPTRAYSCIKYLYTKLYSIGISVECWCKVSENSIETYKDWGMGVRYFSNSKLLNLPKIRTWYMKIMGLWQCIRYRNKVIICHDLFHYQSCVFIKKMFPNTKFILYSTEIYNEKHSHYLYKLQKKFKMNSNTMDYFIECDYLRGAFRREIDKVTCPMGIILNTVPKSVINKYSLEEKTLHDIPKIIFSGGIHEEGEFSIIIDALKEIDLEYEMIFYCFGKKEIINSLVEECNIKIPNKYKIYTNLSREEVYKHISDADIGIVYYDPDYSINTKYAAPTKFYEYIGLAIPVMSSGNDSLKNIIDNYGLGEYMKTNDVEGMKKGLYRLISDKQYRKEISINEKIAFETALCYEEQSKSVIEDLKKIILVENNCEGTKYK